MKPSLRTLSWLTKDGTHLGRAGMSSRMKPSTADALVADEGRAHLVRVGLSRR